MKHKIQKVELFIGVIIFLGGLLITVFSLFQNSRCFIYITHLEYQHDESLLLNYKFLASNLTKKS